jgi:hypothetical protein
MKEIWKDVPTHAGFLASSLGRIRRVGEVRFRRPSPTKDGYLRLLIKGDDGKRRSAFVHQMVLAAFAGPRPEGMVCRHLDGDPSNNRIGNLAYGTQAQNMADRGRHGNNPVGTRNGHAKLTPALVRLARLAHKEGASFRAIARAVNMNDKTIRDICKGRLWKDVA